jgi:photosystem II stability/assembly factor-like uncharacterized protein
MWQSIGLSGGGAMFTPAISLHDRNLMLLNCDMSGAYRTGDGGETWQMLHYSQLASSTRCRPVFHPTDPNVVYAASGRMGELKVSRDRGLTWTKVGGLSPGVSELAIDPGDPQLMLAADGRGVARSTDGGLHWAAATGIAGRLAGFHIVQTGPAGDQLCFAGTSEGVYRSEDGGATWQRTEGPTDLRSFTGGSNAKDGCVLYCAVPLKAVNGTLTGGVYRSTDGGRTWESAMGTGLPTEGRRQPQYDYVLTTNVHPTVIYAASGRGGLFRSDDAGRNWRPVLAHADYSTLHMEPGYLQAETGRWGDNISGIAINPADPDNLIVADWMTASVTRDGGRSWRVANTRQAPGQGAPAKGQRWLNNGLVVTTVWHYYIDPFEHNRHYMAYTDIGYARSTDAGKSWYWQTGRPMRNTTYEIAFDPEVPGKMWAAFADLHDIPNANVISGRHYRAQAGGGVGISEDFGVTWRDTSEGLPSKPVVSVVLDPKSAKEARVLYASLFEAGVFKSVDGGKTWQEKSKGLGAPGVNMRACRLILHNDGSLFCLVTAMRQDDRYLPEGVGLYRSRDGGESWEWINRSHPVLWPKDFDVDPRDSRVIYLGAADADAPEGGLYKTTDGGQSWTRIARQGPQTFGATINPKRPDWVYMALCEGAEGPGLWLSKDAGRTWKPMKDLPFRMIQRVSFDPDDDSVIYVSTFGGSVWKGPAEE